MPRPQDWIGRHAQPRRNTAAGARTGGGAFGLLPEARDSTNIMVIGISTIGNCVLGPSGRFVIGQSEIGTGDKIPPGVTSRRLRRRMMIGYSFMGDNIEVA